MITMEIIKRNGAKMATFKERFIYLKIEKGVNYDEIARAVHTNRTSLSKFAKGELSLKKEMIESIADYFDVDQAYLLGESDIRRQKNKLKGDYYAVMENAMNNEVPSEAIEDYIDLWLRQRNRQNKRNP